MFSSNSFLSVHSNGSASMLYEMEGEHPESEKCDVEFKSADSNIKENTDLEVYFDEPIADEVWLEAGRKQEKDGTV